MEEEKNMTSLELFQGSIRYVALFLLLAFAVLLTLANRYTQYPVVLEAAYVDSTSPPSERLFRRVAVSDEVQRLLENPYRRPDSIRICQIEGTGDLGEMIKTDCEVVFETNEGQNFWESRVYQFPPT